MKGVSEELARHQINTLVQTKWVVFHTAPRRYRGVQRHHTANVYSISGLFFFINFLRKTSFQQKYDTTKTFFTKCGFTFLRL